jgi:amidohydrolase
MNHLTRHPSRSSSIHLATASTLLGVAALAQAQTPTPTLDAAGLAALEQRVAAIAPKMLEWRRDIHSHPELSGQEARTAKLVAEHLKKLGIEVQTGVGGHGVVGLLKGGQPGKTVALRADMDALPVAEVTGLPFASKATQINMGKESPVMHACGHDGHTAILMGVAETLAGMKSQIAGTVKFVFQPAEEGISEPLKDPKQSFGAKAMAEQGAMDGVDVVYGLHIIPQLPVGTIGYRSGPLLSAGDTVNIKVTGKQTHGAMPWNGVDTVVVAAQIVTALQTIVSRQLNIANEPAVLTIGSIHGGNRENIVPDTVELLGTLRTFDEGMRAEAKKRIANTAQSVAQASDAKAEISFGPSAYPVTVNPPDVVEAALPVLKLATGGKAMVIPKVPASEDFSEFQHKVPGMFFMLGALPEGKTPGTAAPNHSPAFVFNEDAMPVGARTLAALTLDYLARTR